MDAQIIVHIIFFQAIDSFIDPDMFLISQLAFSYYILFAAVVYREA